MGWCDVTCGVMVKGGLKVLGDSVGRLHRLSLLSFILACKEVFRVVIHSLPPKFYADKVHHGLWVLQSTLPGGVHNCYFKCAASGELSNFRCTILKQWLLILQCTARVGQFWPHSLHRVHYYTNFLEQYCVSWRRRGMISVSRTAPWLSFMVTPLQNMYRHSCAFVQGRAWSCTLANGAYVFFLLTRCQNIHLPLKKEGSGISDGVL